LFVPQQPLPHSFPDLRQQDAVLSFSLPQQSLQQDAAALSSFMQHLASLPLQHDLASFPEQQEAISLPSCLRMQAAWASFASDDAILSQHGHFALSGAVFSCSADEVLWVAVCVQETIVTVRIKASSLYFITSPRQNEFVGGLAP
jgi:hypothetical protein